MKEGIKIGLRKTIIPVCVAAPLQQQTFDTISELQENLWCIRAMTAAESRYHRLQEISARRPQFLPLSFLHPAIQVGQMIAQ